MEQEEFQSRKVDTPLSSLLSSLLLLVSLMVKQLLGKRLDLGTVWFVLFFTELLKVADIKAAHQQLEKTFPCRRFAVFL